jgi:hypothetical protein
VFDLPDEVRASGCDWVLGNYPTSDLPGAAALRHATLRPWEARMLRLHA